jgi:hypothetical protein
MFKELDESFGLSSSPKPVHSLRLVAIGSLQSIDPDRVVLKKIVLTGFPYKIHKRGAVIKHMFYHPGTLLLPSRPSPTQLITLTRVGGVACRRCAMVRAR